VANVEVDELLAVAARLLLVVKSLTLDAVSAMSDTGITFLTSVPWLSDWLSNWRDCCSRRRCRLLLYANFKPAGDKSGFMYTFSAMYESVDLRNFLASSSNVEADSSLSK